MEGGNGKLFVGGIAWDTDEDRLREYFQGFGDVVEAVIIKDRISGRARGFGFIVFADPLVADRVVKEKNVIDGRIVDVKKAVPRDGPDIIIRNNGGTHSSPGPTRSKKIFVGGLPSDITESDFKMYFDQFGTTTDVVVMYDHNTKRPRGFGFITYDSEEAVENVLVKKFHQLNGKMVEVKRAVPKELNPMTISPLRGGYTDGLYSGYTPGYNLNSVGGYGLRMDGRFSPLSIGRTGYPPISPSSYGRGPILNSGLASHYGNGAFSSTTGYGQRLNTYYGDNSDRFNSPIGYGSSDIGSNISMNSINRDMWVNEHFGPNPASSNNVIGPSRNRRSFDAIQSARGIWGSSTFSGQGVRNRSFSSDNIHYPGEESSILTSLGYGRNSVSSTGATTSHTSRNDFGEDAFEELYGSGSFNGDASGPFTYAFGNSSPEITSDTVGYSLNNRGYRGIAT